VQRSEKARTAEIAYRQNREDEVRYYVQRFNQDPDACLAGLKRSAAGVRHLISRWEELNASLCDEGTWYGAHRCEAILMQGHAAGFDQLFLSEVAWRTWVDCLAAQPLIRQRDVDMLCAPDIVPQSIQDRGEPLWQPDAAASRARLDAIVDRELPRLRALEAALRAQYEEPALAAAKDMALAKLTRDETALLRALRSHEAAFLKATQALEKLRRPTNRAAPQPDAALATPRACDDGARRPPRRRVPITPPFARPGTHEGVSPGPEESRRRSEAGKTEIHDGPVCRNGHRETGPARSPGRKNVAAAPANAYLRGAKGDSGPGRRLPERSRRDKSHYPADSSVMIS
jgi:hypothetical protein